MTPKQNWRSEVVGDPKIIKNQKKKKLLIKKHKLSHQKEREFASWEMGRGDPTQTRQSRSRKNRNRCEVISVLDSSANRLRLKLCRRWKKNPTTNLLPTSCDEIYPFKFLYTATSRHSFSLCHFILA